MYADILTNSVEISVPGDGNCLFNSMEIARYGKVRKEHSNRDASKQISIFLQTFH